MNEQRVNEIVEFWKARTGRAGPKKISIEVLYGFSGLFHMGEIEISIWADDDTVFHELAHLEQWQDGRLWYFFESIGYRPAVSMFEGKRANELPYLERPAEIEARKRVKELMALFAGNS